MADHVTNAFKHHNPVGNEEQHGKGGSIAERGKVAPLFSVSMPPVSMSLLWLFVICWTCSALRSWRLVVWEVKGHQAIDGHFSAKSHGTPTWKKKPLAFSVLMKTNLGAIIALGPAQFKFVALQPFSLPPSIFAISAPQNSYAEPILRANWGKQPFGGKLGRGCPLKANYQRRKGKNKNLC